MLIIPLNLRHQNWFEVFNNYFFKRVYRFLIHYYVRGAKR